jgi:hypothetical protein
MEMKQTTPLGSLPVLKVDDVSFCQSIVSHLSLSRVL